MRPSSPFRPLLPATLALLLLGGCDDPAETAREVMDARGSCSEDSLRVSSETCVRMFGRYAEMITEGMHTYIGGMKAMDRAIQRLPPADFDTAGLGHAITRPSGGLSPDPAPPRFPPTARGEREYAEPPPYDAPYGGPADAWGEPYDPYGPPEEYTPGDVGHAPGGWERGPRGPIYDRGPASEPEPVAEAPPAPRRGVLLPPGARLARPWLGDDDRDAQRDRRDRIVRECEGATSRECEGSGYDRE